MKIWSFKYYSDYEEVKINETNVYSFMALGCISKSDRNCDTVILQFGAHVSSPW